MRYCQPDNNTRILCRRRSPRQIPLSRHPRPSSTNTLRTQSPCRSQTLSPSTKTLPHSVLVGCECMHSWYWLADTCREENIPFALGHAFGMQAVHGARTRATVTTPRPSHDCSRAATSRSPTTIPKNDADYATCSAHDCAWYANAPNSTATSTPHAGNSTCRPSPTMSNTSPSGPTSPPTSTTTSCVVASKPTWHCSNRWTQTIRCLEGRHRGRRRRALPDRVGRLAIDARRRPHHRPDHPLEIDTIERFDSRQQFCSYARLCGACKNRPANGRRRQPQAGQRLAEMGFLRGGRFGQKDERIGQHLDKLASRLGKSKALSVLAHKLGRAFYHMIHKKEVFNLDRFLRH